MILLIGLVHIVLFLISAIRSEDGQPVSLANSEIELLISYHNSIRSRARSTAMKKLIWSVELTTAAQEYAKQCDYSPDGSKITVTGYTNVGVNVYATAAVQRPSLSLAARWWVGQASQYSLPRNSCTPGRICKDYIQIISKSAAEIGCAAAKCNGINDTPVSRAGYVIVCLYGPGHVVNEAPYEPATRTNAVCSKCDAFGAEFWCTDTDHLCSKCCEHHSLSLVTASHGLTDNTK